MNIVTKEQALRVFQTCGVQRGDVLLVHSALRPFGQVDGGAATIAAALREAVGEEGTLVAPAFTFRHEVEERPVIDPAGDRSEMGAISECIRNLPGARRSIAYRHSLSAVGPKAGTIVDVNPVLSVFDMGSSFGRLLALDAKIALLGLTYVSCTSYHFGEYLVQIPCRETVKRQVLLKKPGGALEPMTLLDYQPSPTDDGREYEFPHDFDKLGNLLEEAGKVRVGNIGNAMVRVFRMRDLIYTILEQYPLHPDLFYEDEGKGPTKLKDGVSVSTGDLLDGAGRLVETFWSCVDPEQMHR